MTPVIKKILFVPFGKSHVPSVRHRFLNFQKYLTDFFAITTASGFVPIVRASFSQPDIIFIQKKLMTPIWWLLIKPFLKSKIVFDFDDAIFFPAHKDWSYWSKFKTLTRFRLTMLFADLVLCPNEYLASHARKYSNNVIIFPMAVSRPIKIHQAKNNQEVVFGWAGHPQSLHLLKMIEDQINAFQISHHHFNFFLLSGVRDPQLNFKYDWLPFTDENEKLFFESVDVGLAPSRNTLFDMGKSPIKIVQHFSYGKTVITNMLGGAEDMVRDGNAYLVNGDNWVDAMRFAISDFNQLKIRSESAFKTFQEFHDLSISAKKLLEILHNCIQK